MRAIVQRCANANVSVQNHLSGMLGVRYIPDNWFFWLTGCALKQHPFVDNEVISSIGKGLCVLIGISKNDSQKDMDYIIRKLLNLRIFDDENGKRWSKSVKDKQCEVLCISQFTLYSVLKGNKPDFHMAMNPERSEQFYSDFIKAMKKAYCEEKIKDGKFGAYMQVNIQNDGPVTINLESPSNSKNEPEDTSQSVVNTT